MQLKKLIMFQIKDKTYPDGTKSTATVPVTVIAPNVPDVIYVPKGDKVPDPSTVVTNSNDIKDKIPDTTYTWKTTPDIDKGGHIPAVVVTHWPDGKTTDSKTTIVVTEEINENHEVVRTIVENIPNQDPKTPVKDNGGKKTVASEQKSTLPQTGKKDNVALTAIGVAIAAAGSLLGLADSKKHRS